MMGRKCGRSTEVWKREHDDLLGKASRTEEGTSQDVRSARRESDRFGKGIRDPKQGDRDRR